MRRWSILTLTVSALVAVLGCDSGSVPGGITGAGDLSGDAFAVVGAEDAFTNIEDATMAREMQMQPAVGDDGSFRRHHRHPGHHGSHLGFVLGQLGLSEQQAETVRAMLQAHHTEVRPILEQLRLANQQWIDRANQERERILESVRNGALGEEEAREMLRRLSETTRQAIRDNPENAPFLRALCDTKRELFEEIRTVLDETQRAEWDDWVAGLTGTCLGD